MKAVYLFPLALLLSPCVNAKSSVDKFYEQKKLATTRLAFERAMQRVEQVELGMGEAEFMQVMGASVLTDRGKVVDVMLDGYLGAGPSDLRPARLKKDDRTLTFGYKHDNLDVYKLMVIFRLGKVQILHPLDEETEQELARLGHLMPIEAASLQLELR